jgi:hypothetical protein
MNAKTDTFRVRISPGVRVWQALLMAVALVGSLVLGLLLGRAGTSAGAEDTITTRNSAPVVCIGHVPKRVCASRVARTHGHTAHLPAGGPGAYGG